ncbi:MAG: DMT family transporter [Planctomycetaceae bacterium]|nr:DMT family transporter [Planctomycetaceae bacterium]MCB9952005.1 DMT family transporter [Planctomycetaceae bacterium]
MNQSTEKNELEPANGGISTYLPDIALVSVSLIWGINIPFMKIALDHLDDYVFNAVRLCVSAAALVVFALREKPLQLAQGERPLSWAQLIPYAVFIAGIYQVLFLMGVSRTTSGNTALIIATVPLWTAIIAYFFGGEKLPFWACIGLLIALLGTVVVAFQKGDVTVSGQHSLGNALVVVAAIIWAAGTVYSRPLLKRISPLRLSALSVVIALPIHLFVAYGRYSENLEPLKSVNLWMIIIFSGMLSSGLALPMWSFGVRQAGAAHASVVQNLVPLVAIVAAFFVRGEAISLGQIGGGVLILGGLSLMRSARVLPKPLSEPCVSTDG